MSERGRRHQAGSAMAMREDHVISFAPRAQSRPSGARVRGYDLRRPTTELRDEALHDKKAGGRAGSIDPAHEPRTVTVFEGSYEDAMPVPPPGATTPAVPSRASVRLDASRRDARLVNGASYCKRLQPGRRFVLQEHEIAALDGHYVVTRVEHEGYSAEALPQGRARYQNRFVCAPAVVPLRPRVPHKPRATAETGIVVGPPGQEIHTDDLGRVRVRFFWDLSGRSGDQGTCWLRVAQLWAGAGWGSQFVPRVGMEVLVTYLNGDPDRPIVTGCIYNATHPVPFALPANATQSGIRTSSTPGGNGANELRFEDRRGEERVLLQAQRDMDTIVGHSHNLQVSVDANSRVGGDSVERVGGKSLRTIDGSARESVSGSLTSRVGGSSHREVEGGDSVHIGSDRSLSVGGDLVENVEGDRSASVGAPGDTRAVASSHVYGDHVLSAASEVLIKADAGVVIQCGESRIEVTKDGIKLSGKSLTLAGSESTLMTGKGPSLRLGDVAELFADKVKLFAKDAWLALHQNVEMKGELVKLNCDDEQRYEDEEEEEPKKKKPLKIKLSDATFTAYGDRKFQLIVDGDTYEGTTTPDGVVDKQIPEDAKSIQLVVWIGDYPTGEKRTWTLSNVEMPPAHEVKGLQMRLKNLGYHAGAGTGALDEETAKAIASFQSDSGLSPTGAIDAPTVNALVKAHGS